MQYLSGDFEFIQNGNMLRVGNQYLSKYLYQNEVERALSKEMMDPERARNVISFFQNRIVGPLLAKHDYEMIDHLANCLLHSTYSLGCNVGHMLKVFKEYSQLSKSFFENNHDACKFFEDVANYENSLNPQLPSEKKKIVILTSHSGGGHLSTAQAIEKIAKDKGYEVILLDQHQLASDKGIDAIQILNAQYKGKPLENRIKIWDEVRQKDDNLQGANELWKLAEDVREFVPNEELALTVAKIREINPEMIISTTTYAREQAMLASMTNKPLHFIHTDYDLNSFIQEKLKTMDTNLVNLWVNSEEDELLRETNWLPGIESNKLEEVLADRRAKGRLINTNEIRDLKRRGKIKFAGYPIRKSFFREIDPRKLNKIRQDLNILPNEKFGVLMMGKMAMSAKIKKYMELLLNPNNNYPQPLHINVICGSNKELKQELEDYLANLPADQKNPKVRFTIDGFLNEENLSDRYKVADVLISKPGGATTAEACASGLPMLCCDAYDGEKVNAAFLERHNLGQTLIDESTFVSQLMDLASYKQRGKVNYAPLSWENALASLFQNTNQFDQVNLPRKTMVAKAVTEKPRQAQPFKTGEVRNKPNQQPQNRVPGGEERIGRYTKAEAAERLRLRNFAVEENRRILKARNKK